MARLLIIIATGIILLSGCVSVKKQRSRAYEFFREHPAELAELCGDKFPTRIEYRPGKTEILISKDTIYTKGDTVYFPTEPTIDPETGERTRPFVICPDLGIITERWLRTDSLFQASTAREEQYRLQSERDSRLLAVKSYQLVEAEKKSKRRGWMIAAIIGAIVAYFFLKSRRII